MCLKYRSSHLILAMKSSTLEFKVKPHDWIKTDKHNVKVAWKMRESKVKQGGSWARQGKSSVRHNEEAKCGYHSEYY